MGPTTWVCFVLFCFFLLFCYFVCSYIICFLGVLVVFVCFCRFCGCCYVCVCFFFVFFFVCDMCAFCGRGIKPPAPSWHCRGARVYGHTNTAMHGMRTPPLPPPASRFEAAVLHSYCTLVVHRYGLAGCWRGTPAVMQCLFASSCFSADREGRIWIDTTDQVTDQPSNGPDRSIDRPIARTINRPTDQPTSFRTDPPNQPTDSPTD